MLKAYMNYPNPKVRVHADQSCGEIQKMGKPGQRLARIDLNSLSSELLRFSTKRYAFGANPAENDIWLQVDLGNEDFEVAVVSYVLHLVSQHYSPFQRVAIEQHC